MAIYSTQLFAIFFDRLNTGNTLNSSTVTLNDKKLIVPILIFVGYLKISKVMAKNGESSFGNNKLGWSYS